MGTQHMAESLFRRTAERSGTPPFCARSSVSLFKILRGLVIRVGKGWSPIYFCFQGEQI